MTRDALSAIEISVGEVTDMEARVLARYDPAAGDSIESLNRIVLRGTLRGPYCELARTLPAEFAFHELGSGPSAVAEAVVTEPCMWTDELPHLYQADVQALCGEQIVAEYHGMIGLRSTTPRKTIE
jgi:hypothetical protein